MGNYSVIDFEEFFSERGIDLSASTPEEVARLKLAFESAKDAEEFIKEVNKIISPLPE